MRKKGLILTSIIQTICWITIIWLLAHKDSVQAIAVYQVTTPEPFLGPIYYGRQDIWQVFDHDLPLASLGNENPPNDYVMHYNGTPHAPVTPTPQGDPYIPDGYGYDGHGGIDYSLQYKPVLAGASGTVEVANWNIPSNHRAGYGLYVILDHTPQTSYDTWYGHLSVITVKTGDTITVNPSDPGNRNRILGISGNTGAVFNEGGAGCPDVEVSPTCGQHLHFEVRISGGEYKPVNPYGWVGIDPNGTPLPDPWATITPTPPNPPGAISYNLWQNPPAIIPFVTPQYPGGTPVAEPDVNEAWMVVDDGSSDFIEIGGCWSPNDDEGSYNESYHQAQPISPTPTPPSSCYVRWYIRPDAFTPPGEYDMYVHIPQNSDASRGAVYTIQHNTQQSQAIVVQAAYADAEIGGWAYIGQYEFLMDDSFTEYVQLSNETLEGDGDEDNIVIADAIRLVPVEVIPPPVDVIYVSFSENGMAGNVRAADEDILVYNTSTGEWAMFFDGSDVGLASGDVDAFEMVAGNPDILMSFDKTLHGIEDTQIARFIPSSLGSTTDGTFSLEFSHSALSTRDEDIDAIGFAPDGKLLLSTLSNATVSGIPTPAPQDEDLFTYDEGGNSFALYLDGSTVGLSDGSEDIWGVSVNSSTDEIYLTTEGGFAVDGVSGDGADIFICNIVDTDECDFGSGLFWNGSAHGMEENIVDALFIGNVTCNSFGNGGFENQFLCWEVNSPSGHSHWLLNSTNTHIGQFSAEGEAFIAGSLGSELISSPINIINNTKYRFRFYGQAVLDDPHITEDSGVTAEVYWYDENGDNLSSTFVIGILSTNYPNGGPIVWTLFDTNFICPPPEAVSARVIFYLSRVTLTRMNSEEGHGSIFIDDVAIDSQAGSCPSLGGG